MKYLLGANENFYKACMHTHSTVSDGIHDPEDVKRHYMQHGYSIVAFTDHNVLVPHPELKDDNFLPITSYEFAIPSGGSGPLCKVFHMNLYAKEEMNDVQVCLDSTAYVVDQDKEHLKHIKYTGKDQYLPYCPESVNKVIREAHKHGFLTCYNHPAWSNETIFDFIQYNSYQFFEVFNTGSHYSAKNTITEWNLRDFHTLLKMGHRVYPIFADDAHIISETDDPYSLAFKGYIMINAPELEYSAVIRALEAGDFYASMGPEIKAIYLEDNKFCVHTSDAAEIRIVTAGRNGVRVAAEPGSTVHYAEHVLIPGTYDFVRVEVLDSQGKIAISRGYFEDELEA